MGSADQILSTVQENFLEEERPDDLDDRFGCGEELLDRGAGETRKRALKTCPVTLEKTSEWRGQVRSFVEKKVKTRFFKRGMHLADDLHQKPLFRESP